MSVAYNISALMKSFKPHFLALVEVALTPGDKQTFSVLWLEKHCVENVNHLLFRCSFSA